MVDSLNQPRLRRWGQQILAERALQEVAPVFAAARLPVAPVKGLALGRWLYSDPSERGLLDVDLLVPKAQLTRALACVRKAGWHLAHASRVFGEIVFSVGGVVIEAHSSVGIQDLTGFEVQDVLDRARVDNETFQHPVLRIDDLDHFTLLAANIVKDHFRRGHEHHRRDLELLWPRIAPHLDELVARVRTAGFTTGMHAVAGLMLAYGFTEFRALQERLAPERRLGQGMALAYLRSHDAPTWLGSAMVAWTNDRLATRSRCLSRLPLRASEVIGRRRSRRPGGAANAVADGTLRNSLK